MNSPNPKVSIIIPVYNGSNYLREAIDSALAQTYKNIEIIVVNDGSDDNGATEKIAKSYGNKIRYFKKENGGVASALNLGIKKMTGEYFSWLSHDDMYEKNKIDAQIKYLNTLSSKTTVIACNARVLLPNGIKKNEYIDKNTFDYTDIFLATSAVVGVNGCSLLIPKKAFDQVGVFDINLPITQDYDMWFRISKNFDFKLLEKNLIISRRHADQDSVKKQKICLEDGDDLHHRFLSEISQFRFDSFFDSRQNNIELYLLNYRAYKENGFIRTSSLMIKYILEYYRNRDTEKYNELFDKEIGKVINRGLALSKKSSKPRIAVYCNVWQRGGIERVISKLIPHLQKKYDCILLINESSDDVGGYFIPSTVTKIMVNSSYYLNSITSLSVFIGISVFIGNPNFNDKFLDIYSTLKNLGIKTIAYNHGYYFLPYLCGGYLYRTALKIKKAYNNADAVVWLTEIAKSIYDLDSSNGLCIYNPIELPSRPMVKKVSNKKIITVGRFNDQVKQLHQTLLVFNDLLKYDNKLQLKVVGPVDFDMQINDDDITVGEFVKNLNLPPDNLTFLGEVENVTDHYDNSSLLILTSKCEGFGMVFLEAMSRGLPCASYYFLGIEEIITDNKNGWIVPQGSHNELAKKIFETLQDNTSYAKMSHDASLSINKFNINSFYESWDKVLDTLLADKPIVSKKKSLSIENYNNIIAEYHRSIEDIIKTYVRDINNVQHNSIGSVGKIESVTSRLKFSLINDGLLLSIEKILRKVLSKLKIAMFR